MRKTARLCESQCLQVLFDTFGRGDTAAARNRVHCRKRFNFGTRKERFGAFGLSETFFGRSLERPWECIANVFSKSIAHLSFLVPFLHVHVLGCLPWFQYIILYQALRLRFAFPNIPKVKHIETMLHVWLSSAACSIFKHVIFRIRRWTCPIHRGKCIEEFSSRTSSPSLHGLVCVWKRACYSREFRSRKHVMGKSPVRARDTSWGCSWVMDHSPRNASSPWLRACKTEIIVAVELKLYVIVTKTMVFNVLPTALNCMQRRVPFLHRKAYMLRYFGLYRLKSWEKRAEIGMGAGFGTLPAILTLFFTTSRVLQSSYQPLDPVA